MENLNSFLSENTNKTKQRTDIYEEKCFQNTDLQSGNAGRISIYCWSLSQWKALQTNIFGFFLLIIDRVYIKPLGCVNEKQILKYFREGKVYFHLPFKVLKIRYIFAFIIHPHLHQLFCVICVTFLFFFLASTFFFLLLPAL